MDNIDIGDAHIPKLGFGTFELRGKAARDMVSRAIETGYRHIDTAQMYGNETEVGRGIRDSGIERDNLWVTTKVWPDRFRDGDFQHSVAESLDRLNVGAVDLLLLHWPSGEVPLAETINALNEVRDRGLTRHIGVSNFTVALLNQAVSLSTAPLIGNQVEYHPYLSQKPVLDALRRHGMALTAYCPLAKGRVFDDSTLARVAANHDKQPGQVVLRWHYQQHGVAAIPRSSRPEHMRANFDIFDFRLTDAEMNEISGLAQPRGRLINPAGLAPQWD